MLFIADVKAWVTYVLCFSSYFSFVTNSLTLHFTDFLFLFWKKKCPHSLSLFSPLPWLQSSWGFSAVVAPCSVYSATRGLKLSHSISPLLFILTFHFCNGSTYVRRGEERRKNGTFYTQMHLINLRTYQSPYRDGFHQHGTRCIGCIGGNRCEIQ